jgi:hypothetical protein
MPKVNCLLLRSRSQDMHITGRKHSEVYKNGSNNVCEYNRTEIAGENPGKINPELFFLTWNDFQCNAIERSNFCLSDCSSYGFHCLYTRF